MDGDDRPTAILAALGIIRSSGLRQQFAQKLANHAPPLLARAVECERIDGLEAGMFEREPRAA